MANVFSESVENAKTTFECWEKVIDFLRVTEGPGGEKFNQRAEVPGTEQELGWFDQRAIAISNLVKSLDNAGINSDAPVPLVYIDQLEQSLQQFKMIVLEADDSMKQVDDKGVASLNPSTWEIVVNETDANLNFASHLQGFKSHAEDLLTKYYQIAPIVRAKEFDGFAEAVRGISKKKEIVQKNTDAVSKAKKSVENDATATTDQKDQAIQDRTEIATVLSTAQETLAKITTANQFSETALEKVSEILDKADSLKLKIDGYEAQFQTFQETLDDRNISFKKWTEDVESLYAGLKEKDGQIVEMIQRAEEMLMGATNAGLASTFNSTLSELDKKLKWAQRDFYFSIFFLLGSALLILFSMFSFAEPQTNDTNGTANDILKYLVFSFNENNLSLSGTIALVLLIVPAIWVTKFSAARHHQLFQLREDYQYKYSLAMAVDGFKKQAPSHADEIAAETFHRLLFNPTDRLEGKEASDDYPSPLMNWLMNKLDFNAKGQ